MDQQVRTMRPFVLGVFLIGVPIGVGASVSRTLMSLNVYGSMNTIGFVLGVLVTVPIGYAIYRVLTAPRPGRVKVEPDRLEFSFEDGRCVEWSFAGLRTVLLLAVTGPHGKPIDFASERDMQATPVPFIQRGIGTRFALLNDAVESIAESLRRAGWKEAKTNSSGPSYEGVRRTLSRP